MRQGRPNRAASTFASVRASAECEALDLRHLGDKIEVHIARLMGRRRYTSGRCQNLPAMAASERPNRVQVYDKKHSF